MTEDLGTDQILVRLTKTCNLRCVFCNVSDNENLVNVVESIDDLVRNLHYKLKYSNYKKAGAVTIVISGGEPTLFIKETLFIVKYAKELLKKQNIKVLFTIQTNAVNITEKLAKALKENGIDEALVSFHTVDKEIFEKIIGVPFNSNFQKIINGINILNKAGIRVSTNSILNNLNREDYFNTIRYVCDNFPFVQDINIGLLQPHGEAYKNFNKLLFKFSEVENIYNSVIFYLKKNKKNVISHFFGLPPCYLHIKSTSAELMDNKVFRKEFRVDDIYQINKLNDQDKQQGEECEECLFNNVCSGIWKEYMGFQQLRPITIQRDYKGSFVGDELCYKLKSRETQLKKIYDKNIRQIIIPASIGNKEEIYSLFKRSTELGFYKISFLVDMGIALEEDIFLSGVNNIQSDIKYLNLSFVSKLVLFSSKSSLQFRIYLDIFVYDLVGENVEKLQKIIEQLPNSFLNIFFIDYNNKMAYSFNSFISKIESEKIKKIHKIGFR